MINVYIIFELKSCQFSNDDRFSLKKIIMLTKKGDIDKYSYSRYGISFAISRIFHFQAVIALIKR